MEEKTLDELLDLREQGVAEMRAIQMRCILIDCEIARHPELREAIVRNPQLVARLQGADAFVKPEAVLN